MGYWKKKCIQYYDIATFAMFCSLLDFPQALGAFIIHGQSNILKSAYQLHNCLRNCGIQSRMTDAIHQNVSDFQRSAGMVLYSIAHHYWIIYNFFEHPMIQPTIINYGNKCPDVHLQTLDQRKD